MSEALLQLLARAVEDNLLSEDEASDLLSRLGDVAQERLPLPIAEAVPPEAALRETVSALLDHADLDSGASGSPDAEQEAFEQAAREAAETLAQTGDLRTWHETMLMLITKNIVAQAVAGFSQP